MKGLILRMFLILHTERKNQSVARKLLKEKEINIELGAGGTKRTGWTSLDLCGADINIDLIRKRLPFPDKSIDRFYSSHVFEHFSYPVPMLSIIKECYRCLKDGGIFSICVPNAAIYVDAYLRGEYPNPNKIYKPASHNNSKMDIINYMAYMDGHHKYMFDIENLLNILSNAGFENVMPRDFDPQLDLEDRRFESIFAVAIKNDKGR